MAASTAAKNRRVRQEALREWLSEKCTAQHLVDNLLKIEGLDPESESFANELNKLRIANEQRLKIMNKYIPDLKAVELSGEVDQKHTVRVVDLSGIVEDVEQAADNGDDPVSD